MHEHQKPIPDAELSDHDPREPMTVWLRRFLDYNEHIVDELEELDPTIVPRINEVAGNLHQVDAEHSMLTTIAHSNLNRFILDRTKDGLPTSAETSATIKELLGNGNFIEHHIYLANMLRNVIGEIDSHDTETAYEFLQKQPKAASDLARTSLDTALTLANDEQRLTPEIEQSIMNSLAATLLSGHQQTYAHIHRQALNAYKTFYAKDKHAQAIHDVILRQPERLLGLFASRQEDPDKLIDTYRLTDVLLSLVVATRSATWESVRDNRRAVLEYAKQIVFNPHISDAFRAAFSHTQKTFAEGRPAPEALNEAIEMDWEPFPETDLNDYAREVVEAKAESAGRESKPLTVDLERLEILRRIREYWGSDRSEYRRGVRKSRKRKAQTEEGEEYFDEYIILVLQHFDEAGNVIREDAIAESPIAGRNALYVQRQDVNGWEWDELFRHRKDNVKAMGARDLKHVVPAGYDMVGDMTDKVVSLLTCSEEEFLEARFNRTPQGKPRLHIPKRVMDIVIGEGLETTQTDRQTHLRDDGDDL